MEESVHQPNESDHRWCLSSRRAQNGSVRLTSSSFMSLCFAEVAYDAVRDEKEQHEAKMRDLEKVEKLRKEKEEASEDERTILLLALPRSLDRRCSRTGEEQ